MLAHQYGKLIEFGKNPINKKEEIKPTAITKGNSNGHGLL